MKTVISFIVMALVTLAAVNGHAQSGATGSHVATVKNGDYEILIPTDRIQAGLNKLFGPSKKDFPITSVSVITYEGSLYLQVSGVKSVSMTSYEDSLLRKESGIMHETCLIPLTERNGELFEMIGLESRIVLCAGKGEGCQPRLTENGWFCSDSTEECEKSVVVTDHSIFE
jgi:hypothetical protein